VVSLGTHLERTHPSTAECSNSTGPRLSPGHNSFRSFRFFDTTPVGPLGCLISQHRRTLELVLRERFISDHMKPPGAEDRSDPDRASADPGTQLQRSNPSTPYPGSSEEEDRSENPLAKFITGVAISSDARRVLTCGITTKVLSSSLSLSLAPSRSLPLSMPQCLKFCWK